MKENNKSQTNQRRSWQVQVHCFLQEKRHMVILKWLNLCQTVNMLSIMCDMDLLTLFSCWQTCITVTLAKYYRSDPCMYTKYPISVFGLSCIDYCNSVFAGLSGYGYHYVSSLAGRSKSAWSQSRWRCKCRGYQLVISNTNYLMMYERYLPTACRVHHYNPNVYSFSPCVNKDRTRGESIFSCWTCDVNQFLSPSLGQITNFGQFKLLLIHLVLSTTFHHI